MAAPRQQGIFHALAARLRGWRKRRVEAPPVPSGVALIQGMGWHQFELRAAEGFRQRGYTVSETGGGGGRAVDMVLTRGQECYLVDCKPWRARAVGVAPLRELFSIMGARGAVGGFVLSSGVFTPEAVQFSESRNIQLIDGTRLRELLNAREEKTVPLVRRDAPFLDTTLPPSAWRARYLPCPLCGGAMVERMQTQGPQAGRRVLGCCHFPLCEGTREL